MLIDQSVILTVSFTVYADQRNAENIFVIRSEPKIESAFATDYRRLLRSPTC